MADSFVVLHPRAAPVGRIQLWVGAFHYTDPPALTWLVDGVERSPDIVRPLESARRREWVEEDEPRAFTGLFEFRSPAIQIGRSYTVRVEPDHGRGDAIDNLKSLPPEMPPGPNRWFNLLLVSCFYWKGQSRGGIVAELIRRLPRLYRPDMTLLLGDQVYLDLPPFYPFRPDAAWLAENFENKYRRNWSEGQMYQSVLNAAPSVSIPDDHEYWNNFPHAASIIPSTWRRGWRDQWRDAASRMYEAFQMPVVPVPAALRDENEEIIGENLGDPAILTIPPVSLCILDSRSCRRDDRSQSIKPEALDVLRNWVKQVTRDGHFGLIATGQSYLEEPAGWTGRFADYKLTNYEDVEDQIEQILELAWAGGRPAILVTGDVHWGRLVASRAGSSGPFLLYEVISSPTSLVEDPRAKVGRAWKAFKGLFGGEQDPWPEHSEPASPPSDFGLPDEPARQLHAESLHPQKGNHLAVLGFQRFGLGVRMRVAYWPIHPDFVGTAPSSVQSVTLKKEPLPR